MAFRLLPNEYFQGVVVEPEGARCEIIVVDKGTRVGTVDMTVFEARKRGWDWIIRLVRDEKDEDNTVTELARWSEIAGDDLPPTTRAGVPGLN